MLVCVTQEGIRHFLALSWRASTLVALSTEDEEEQRCVEAAENYASALKIHPWLSRVGYDLHVLLLNSTFIQEVYPGDENDSLNLKWNKRFLEEFAMLDADVLDRWNAELPEKGLSEIGLDEHLVPSTETDSTDTNQ